MIANLARLLLLVAVSAGAAAAQELHFLGGPLSDAKGRSSYSWQICYLEGLTENLAWSAAWINEGHVPSHHRDGPAAQLWARANILDRQLWLAAGAGPYRYFDTERARRGRFKDAHGWAGVASVSAAWYTGSRWIFQLRGDHVFTDNNLNTSSVLAGVGYQLEAPDAAGPEPRLRGQDIMRAKNEITLFMGQTIVNSFSSQSAAAKAVEYRRKMLFWLDASAGWIYEGDARLIRRNGVSAQLWPTRSFFGDRFSLGMGFGAYASVDTRRHPAAGEAGDDTLSTLMTLTAAWRFEKHFLLRASWNRTGTSYNRDTDIIVAGLGAWF